MAVLATLERNPQWGFYALGVAFGLLGVAHLLTEGEGAGTALEALIIVGMASMPLYTGVEACRVGLDHGRCRDALDFTLATAVAFALLAVAVAATWTLEGTLVVDAQFMVWFAGALGAGIGSRAALAAARMREETDRAQELNRLLKVNQRVLRHNLRNELAIVGGHLDNLEAQRGGDPDVAVAREHLERLVDVSESARRIVTVWETDSRTEQPLASVVEDARDRVCERHPDADVTVDVPDTHRVLAHAMLGEAVEELLANAVEHNPPDVSVTVTAAEAGGTVTLRVADTGVGLGRGDREAVFLREETPLSHARGLGLLLVYWTVHGSDGELAFDEHATGGTVVTLRLPSAGSFTTNGNPLPD